MDPKENHHMYNQPFIKIIFGIMIGFLVLLFSVELNKRTDSHWGLVLLILAVPLISYFLKKNIKSKKNIE